MTQVAGKTAIVTGGGGGIGGAIAAELAHRGARVAVTDFDAGRAAATAERINQETGDGRAIGLRLDVTRQADFDEARVAIEKCFGPVDIIISNAGVGHTTLLGELTVEAFAWVHDVNVNASARALHTFLPQLRERGTPGHVLLTSSITALRPFPGQAAYTSAKAALLNLSLALEMELRDTPINVSVLCPGIVATELRKNADAARPQGVGPQSPGKSGPSPLAQGMAPSSVASAAITGIVRDDFYIFPHPDYRNIIAREQQAVLQAMSVSAQPGYREADMFLAPIR